MAPLSPTLADGSMPRDPVSWAASSLIMSPNMFPASITSKSRGLLTSCMAALSTYKCSSATSGNSRAPISATVSLQSTMDSRTFDLSTDASLFFLFRAISNAVLATLSISEVE